MHVDRRGRLRPWLIAQIRPLARLATFATFGTLALFTSFKQLKELALFAPSIQVTTFKAFALFAQVAALAGFMQAAQFRQNGKTRQYTQARQHRPTLTIMPTNVRRSISRLFRYFPSPFHAFGSAEAYNLYTDFICLLNLCGGKQIPVYSLFFLTQLFSRFTFAL